MASLVDLFNPTFLMFLGILVLVISVLVVYYESKMREQNQKIAGMFSLVSTMAQDMTKMANDINNLSLMQLHSYKNMNEEPLEKNDIQHIKSLIEVSDDEDEYEDDETEEEYETDESEDNEESSQGSEGEDIKVVKLNISDDEEEEDGDVYTKLDDIDEAEDIEFRENDLEEQIPDISDDYVEQVLDLKYEDGEKEDIKEELKTISINLSEEPQSEIDYKKMQLQKLRSVAVEKGLTTSSDASKLKKHDLLKLLGAE